MKSLRRVSIITTREAEDAVAEMLGTVMGGAAVSHFNMVTGVSTVTVYCETEVTAGIREAIAAGLEQIRRCGLKAGPGKITVAKIRREDWAESWKRHFKPMEINHRGKEIKSLLIKPGWSRKRPRRDQAVVVLNPGLSFGTGQHPTTMFCLRQIVRLQKAGARRSFLDIGCGSGILAIAAAKLGYAPVRALDNDADAVRIAQANARSNRVGAQAKAGRGDVAKLLLHPAHGYDLVCANLISDLLIAHRQRIAAQLNRGGTLVLAGILKREFREVQAAYEEFGFKLVSRTADKEWESGAFDIV
jgi:ribosomal protein L11 methyltransferase